jgi:DNA replication and repair protein RecF
VILDRLSVSGLRNIESISISPDRRINWFSGSNGAGKTSLLEAIYLIARGRSFRGKKHGPLLGRGNQRLEISATVLFGNGSKHRTVIGYRQTKESAQFFDSGRAVASAQDIRLRPQIRLIPENAQILLEGAPRLRRLFLDWNLFHVEHRYPRLLSEFRRVLTQRNAWLRSGANGPPVWDAPYCQLSCAVTSARQSLADHLERRLRATTKESNRFKGGLHLDFRRGWPIHRQLASVLTDSLEQDKSRGYTFYGPARADFHIRLDSHATLLSRGQTKLLVFHLQLGAQSFGDTENKENAIWLLDDLAAELDTSAVDEVLSALFDTQCQIFVTTLEGSAHGIQSAALPSGSVFHVEQGRVRT